MISSLSRKSIIVITALFLLLCGSGISLFSLSVKARNANQTEILVDQKTNAVKIVVGGKVIALINENGLQVDGPVRSHSGPLDNSGTDRAGGDHHAQ